MRGSWLLAVLVGGALAAGATGSVSATPSRCPLPPGANLAAQGRNAVIYYYEDITSEEPYVLCDKRTGVSHGMLGPVVGRRDGINTPVFSGSFVAVQYQVYRVRKQLGVYDVRSGRRTFYDPKICDLWAVLAINARGSVAWGCSDDVGLREIAAHDARGTRVVDREPGLKPGSLRLTRGGTLLTWKVNGTTKTAPLT